VRVRWIAAWALLYGYCGLAAIAGGLYRGLDLEPTAGFELVTRGAFVMAISAWFVEYAHRKRLPLPMDIGLFLYAASFVVVPYYVVRAEGWRRGVWILIQLTIPLVMSTAVEWAVVRWIAAPVAN
jgi:hypothetical protein